MTARVLIVALLAALTAGCGDDNSLTEPTTTATTATTVTYAGTIDPGGSRFYSFTNSQAGLVTAFLASASGADGRQPLATPLELGIGIPAGTDCPATTTQIVAPSLVTQMSVSLAAGVYCLRVADAGELRASITFAVRFTHP